MSVGKPKSHKCFTDVALLFKSSYKGRRGETLAKIFVLLYGWPLTNVASH